MGIQYCSRPPCAGENTVLYASALFSSCSFTDEVDFQPLSYLLEQARTKELYVYGVLDLNVGEWDPSVSEEAEQIRRAAEEAAAAFPRRRVSD